VDGELAPAVGLDEAAGRQRLHVGAAREGPAGARDDRDPDVGIVLDALPARAELVAHLLVHGVQAVGAVERDGRHALGDVEDHGVHAPR